MARRAFLLLLLIGAGALVLWPFVRGGSPGEHPPLFLEPYQWGNGIVLSAPPAEAWRPSVFGDPVERALGRMQWGEPELVYWTQQNLPEDRERLARRIEEQVERTVQGSPLGAMRLVETLGAIQDPRSVPLLASLARSAPDFLQLQAIRALAQYPADDVVDGVLAELSGHADRGIRHAAMQAILERPWSLQMFVEFLENRESPEVDPVLEAAGKARLGGAADAIARHLDGPSLHTRQLAILALLRLGDPRGLEEATQELRSGEASRVFSAYTILRDGQTLPPLALADRHLRSPEVEMRREVVQALAGSGTRSPQEREEVVALLEKAADDPDGVVRRIAAGQLSRRGHHQWLQPYLEALRSSHGDELKEAIQFLCEDLADAEAGRVTRRRLLRVARTATSADPEILGALRGGDVLVGLVVPDLEELPLPIHDARNLADGLQYCAGGAAPPMLRVQHENGQVEDLPVPATLANESLPNSPIEPLLYPGDEIQLLFGLRYVPQAGDAAAFVRRVLPAGTRLDERGSDRLPISDFAALYVQSLGADAEPPLLAALQAPIATPRARLLLLDALRGIASQTTAASREVVFGLIEDSGQPLEVRLAAVETVKFFADPALGPRLLETAGRLQPAELVQHARLVYVCYF